jgi:hypothetical protein
MLQYGLHHHSPVQIRGRRTKDSELNGCEYPRNFICSWFPSECRPNIDLLLWCQKYFNIARFSRELLNIFVLRFFLCFGSETQPYLHSVYWVYFQTILLLVTEFLCSVMTRHLYQVRPTLCPADSISSSEVRVAVRAVVLNLCETAAR